MPSSLALDQGALISNRVGAKGDQSGMRQISQQAIDQIADIIAEASHLPLLEAAFALWRQMPRLNSLEERYPSCGSTAR